MRENILKWLRYVLWRNKTDTVISVKEVYVNGKRKRERPIKKWEI